MDIRRSDFQVNRGQLTFDAEGQESGRFFSRRISKPPGAASGVTIGRGYDMGLRSRSQIASDLEAAGVPGESARLLSLGAGKRGEAAREFVEQNLSSMPILNPKQQKRLFEKVLYPWYERDTERLSQKADVVKKYGKLEWKLLDPKIRELLVDLRFRGDYTPRTRQKIQSLVVQNDVQGLLRVMQDRNFWINSIGVPIDRFERRMRSLIPATATTSGVLD